MAERVEIDIIARTEKAISGLDSFIKKIAATYISYRALKALLVSSIKDALEEEKAYFRLASAIKVSGQNSEVATKQLMGLARAISLTSTSTHEDIQDAMASLTQIGRVSAEGMKKIIPVVMQLSRGLGVDLGSAAMLVGKAIEGNTGALGRYGIKIKETADPVQRFNTIIKELGERFGPMTAEMSKSASVNLAQIKNEFNELKEAAGAKLLQTFKDTIFGLSSMLKASAVMKTPIGDIGSKEEATAYITTLSREIKRLQEDIKKVSTYAPLTGWIFPKGKPASLKYIEEIKARINEINVMVANMPKTKGVGLLLPGVSDDAADKLKKIELTSYAFSDALSKLRFTEEDYIITTFKAGQATYDFDEALKRISGATEKASETFKNMNQYLVYTAPYENSMDAINAIKKASEKIRSEWTEIGNQVADWSSALGAAFATGDFDALMQKILSMTVTLAIQAAASAAVAQNWPMVAFWLGVAGLGVGASILGGAVTANTGDKNIPAMAGGGIVTSPTLALIGEKGPEAVVPLGRGMGGTTINVYGSIWQTQDLARAVAGAQSRW